MATDTHIDEHYTNSLDMWTDMIGVMGPQHPNVGFPGIPFIFDKKHSRIVVSHGTIVYFNNGIGRAIGHFGLLMMAAGGRTMPGIVKPIDTTTDIYHVQSSIIDSQQIFGDSVSPFLRPVMYTRAQDERIEFVNLHYESVSAKTLDTLQIKLTHEQGESVKFQDGKVVLTSHFKQKS